ncbi:MAG TPA: hypothetical protein VEU52_08800, partial [Candidatus Limnocylindrales bacterium]|nr:hypothetical protein [Candidatus Limnocylindrales bacterium]
NFPRDDIYLIHASQFTVDLPKRARVQWDFEGRRESECDRGGYSDIKLHRHGLGALPRAN